MKTQSINEMPGLEFDFSGGAQEQVSDFHAPSNRIGFISAEADTPGATYDITVKNALGNILHEMKNCGNEKVKHFGEQVKIETSIGEDLQFVVSNVKGAKKVNLFIN